MNLKLTMIVAHIIRNNNVEIFFIEDTQHLRHMGSCNRIFGSIWYYVNPCKIKIGMIQRKKKVKRINYVASCYYLLIKDMYNAYDNNT